MDSKFQNSPREIKSSEFDTISEVNYEHSLYKTTRKVDSRIRDRYTCCFNTQNSVIEEEEEPETRNLMTRKISTQIPRQRQVMTNPGSACASQIIMAKKDDLKLPERRDFFYQTLNDSGASFTATSSPTSVNNLFATTPISRLYKQKMKSQIEARAMTLPT